MKKLYSLLFAMLLAAGILAGCGESTDNQKESAEPDHSQTEHQEASAFPVTIKDALDHEVVIDSKPEGIVSLLPSNTEIVFELGLGEQIVGVSDFDNYPPEALEKEKIGGQEFNVEKVVSLAPNLVLAHASTADMMEAGLQQLRDAGIAVLVVNDAKNFDEVYETIDMIGKASGEQEKAEKLIADMKQNIEEVETKAKAIKDTKSVLVEVSPAPEIFAPGKNTFMDEMLQIINAENIVTEDGWMQMDSEAVVERNPDVIITTHGFYTEDPVENVLKRDGWQDITAVKNKQVTDVDSDMVTRTGPRLDEGVEELAKAVYPDIFK